MKEHGVCDGRVTAQCLSATPKRSSAEADSGRTCISSSLACKWSVPGFPGKGTPPASLGSLPQPKLQKPCSWRKWLREVCCLHSTYWQSRHATQVYGRWRTNWAPDVLDPGCPRRQTLYPQRCQEPHGLLPCVQVCHCVTGDHGPLPSFETQAQMLQS